MHLNQRFHDRLQNGNRLVIGDLIPVFCQVGFQAHTVYVLHHKVCGAVLFEIVLHRYDMRGVLQLGKDLRFIQKALHTVLVILLHPSGQRHTIVVRMPCGQGGGHIFFNRNLDLQCQVVSQIGDTEPANAKHLSHQISPV